MAGGGRIGGQGSMIQRTIWVFVACCIVVAVWNTFPHEPKAAWVELEHKSAQFKSLVLDVVDRLGLDDIGSGVESDRSVRDDRSGTDKNLKKNHGQGAKNGPVDRQGR